MVPYNQTIEVYRGDTYTQSFRLRQREWNSIAQNPQGGVGMWVPGAYRDLTGWSGAFQIRTQPDEAEPAGVGEVTFGDQTNSNTTGLVTYTLPSSVAQGLVPNPAFVPTGYQDWLGGGWMYYDVQLTDPGGNVRTYLAGLVMLVKDITR